MPSGHGAEQAGSASPKNTLGHEHPVADEPGRVDRAWHPPVHHKPPAMLTRMMRHCPHRLNLNAAISGSIGPWASPVSSGRGSSRLIEPASQAELTALSGWTHRCGDVRTIAVQRVSVDEMAARPTSATPRSAGAAASRRSGQTAAAAGEKGGVDTSAMPPRASCRWRRWRAVDDAQRTHSRPERAPVHRRTGRTSDPRAQVVAPAASGRCRPTGRGGRRRRSWSAAGSFQRGGGLGPGWYQSEPSKSIPLNTLGRSGILTPPRRARLEDSRAGRFRRLVPRQPLDQLSNQRRHHHGRRLHGGGSGISRAGADPPRRLDPLTRPHRHPALR